MEPTRILNNEHRVIEQVLDCLEVMARRCRQDGRLDGASAREAIDFFRNYADRCHHGKEEQQLFPMMEARGFPAESGPVAVMRIEHEDGRALIRQMEGAIEEAAAGAEPACAAFVRAALGYLGLLRDHIRKEDHCLFPMAEQALSTQDTQQLGELFARADAAEFGLDERQRLLDLADRLAERFDVARGRVESVYGEPSRCG